MEVDEVKLLEKYFRALTNLYGVIQLKKIYEIYSIYNKIDEDLFYKFCDILKHQDEEFRIMCLSEIFSNLPKLSIKNRYVISCDYDDPAKLNELLKDQIGKEYCILEEQLFLKYSDEMFFEKNDQFKELYKHIKNNYKVNTDFFCKLIVYSTKEGCPFNKLIRCTDELNFKTMEEANIVIDLITKLYNNTRIHANCGNAGAYLAQKTVTKIKPQHFNSNVSRNELCTCGSGKKYKKCCMLIN